jgi:hypothetical protein
VVDRFIVTGGVILAGLLLYRFRQPILDRLKQFDEDNRARLEGDERDRHDSLAHYRHTLARAEEQVDAIEEITLDDVRTGLPVTRYLFEGERFATLAEAERARAEKVRAVARAFYVELPAALAARNEGKLR